jgi:hypothetical protein
MRQTADLPQLFGGRPHPTHGVTPRIRLKEIPVSNRFVVQCAAVFTLCAALRAETITYTAQSGTSSFPYSNLTAQLPQFDPALGSLTNMEVACFGQVLGDLGFENTAASPHGEGLVFFAVSGSMSGPGVNFNMSGDYPWQVPTLGAFDGVIDYAGSSGVTMTLPQWLAAGHGFWNFFPGDTLDAWTGLGTMPMTGSGVFSISANGLTWDENLQVRLEFSVRYTYTNEPSEFCFGHLIQLQCPCGSAMFGCANSAGTSGARLVPSGSSSLANDTFTLTASGMTPSTSVLFFQGSSSTQAGTAFGDGVRCTSGTLVRVGTKTAVNGVAQYPGPGDAPISVAGQVPGAGVLRAYQALYRDLGNFCTPHAFNLTSGVRTRWTQ